MPTQLVYRQAVARALDDLELHLVASGTGATVIASTLVNSLTAASVSRYDDAYIYTDSYGFGEVKAVKMGGYAPSTGTLTIQHPSGFNTAPVAGSIIEITRLFPAVAVGSSLGTQTDTTDYRSLINRALGRLLVTDHLDLTTVAGQHSYSLTAYAAWLDRVERFINVFDPPRAVGYPRKDSWRNWQLKLDGGAPAIETVDRPYPVSGATFQLLVYRPANTLINGAESTVGLVSDTDTAVPTVEEVVTVALAFAYEALLNRSPGRPTGNYAGRYETQMALARGLRNHDRTQDAQSAPAASEAA